jgi:hypothetical protein
MSPGSSTRTISVNSLAEIAWRRAVARHWHEARFGPMKVDTEGAEHRFAVEVYLGALDPESVRIELYADPRDGGPPFRQTMTRARKLDAPGDGYVYAASVPASRSTSDFTPRIVAHHPHVMVPLERARSSGSVDGRTVWRAGRCLRARGLGRMRTGLEVSYGAASRSSSDGRARWPLSRRRSSRRSRGTRRSSV